MGQLLVLVLAAAAVLQEMEQILLMEMEELVK
jgi:hypothetical protein